VAARSTAKTTNLGWVVGIGLKTKRFGTPFLSNRSSVLAAWNLGRSKDSSVGPGAISMQLLNNDSQGERLKDGQPRSSWKLARSVSVKTTVG
jgi:hypothetical protein